MISVNGLLIVLEKVMYVIMIVITVKIRLPIKVCLALLLRKQMTLTTLLS